MVFVSICELKRVSFEVAKKELDKNTQGLKMYSNRTIHNGTTEIMTYRNTDCTKVIEVNIHHNKKDNTYNLNVCELVELRKIKVIKVNGDYFYTRIKGKDSDIIDHYNGYNLSCDKKSIQVKEIEFYHNDGGFSGLMDRKVIYNFILNSKLNCYQY